MFHIYQDVKKLSGSTVLNIAIAIAGRAGQIVEPVSHKLEHEKNKSFGANHSIFDTKSS